VQWRPDGKAVLVGTADGQLLALDARTGQPLSQLRLAEGGSRVAHLAWRPAPLRWASACAPPEPAAKGPAERKAAATPAAAGAKPAAESYLLCCCDAALDVHLLIDGRTPVVRVAAAAVLAPHLGGGGGQLEVLAAALDSDRSDLDLLCRGGGGAVRSVRLASAALERFVAADLPHFVWLNAFAAEAAAAAASCGSLQLSLAALRAASASASSTKLLRSCFELAAGLRHRVAAVQKAALGLRGLAFENPAGGNGALAERVAGAVEALAAEVGAIEAEAAAAAAAGCGGAAARPLFAPPPEGMLLPHEHAPDKENGNGSGAAAAAEAALDARLATMQAALGELGATCEENRAALVRQLAASFRVAEVATLFADAGPQTPADFAWTRSGERFVAAVRRGDRAAIEVAASDGARGTVATSGRAVADMVFYGPKLVFVADGAAAGEGHLQVVDAVGELAAGPGPGAAGARLGPGAYFTFAQPEPGAGPGPLAVSRERRLLSLVPKAGHVALYDLEALDDDDDEEEEEEDEEGDEMDASM